MVTQCLFYLTPISPSSLIANHFCYQISKIVETSITDTERLNRDFLILHREYDIVDLNIFFNVDNLKAINFLKLGSIIKH